MGEIRMLREIKEKRFEIDSKKIELDFLQQQFLVECKRFAAQIIEGKVRQAISLNPEKAIRLGKEGLTPIKKSVTALLENISETVEGIVNQDEYWQHSKDSFALKDYPPDLYFTSEKEGPKILSIPIRKILSPVGELLLLHGLDTKKNWDKEKETVLYRHPLEWSKDMLRIITQYHERFNELSRLIGEYEVLAAKDTGNDALELWDSI